MSQPNVEAVRGFYADPRGLTVAWSDVLAPEAEFDMSALYPDMAPSAGVAAVQRLRDTGPWVGSSIHLEPERFFDVDDERVLVFVRVSATGQESGVEVEVSAAHEFTFRAGRLTRFKAYRDRDEALRAVGMAP
jgi:ketosteroid isomerase-like protein